MDEITTSSVNAIYGTMIPYFGQFAYYLIPLGIGLFILQMVFYSLRRIMSDGEEESQDYESDDDKDEDENEEKFQMTASAENETNENLW